MNFRNTALLSSVVALLIGTALPTQALHAHEAGEVRQRDLHESHATESHSNDSRAESRTDSRNDSRNESRSGKSRDTRSTERSGASDSAHGNNVGRSDSGRSNSGRDDHGHDAKESETEHGTEAESEHTGMHD